jgi:hypothetical protein
VHQHSWSRYEDEASEDLGFYGYNSDGSESAMKELVKESPTFKVPYKENRVVLFNSNLFHETDKFHFKPGYKNRRINITLLFGKRGKGYLEKGKHQKEKNTQQ